MTNDTEQTAAGDETLALGIQAPLAGDRPFAAGVIRAATLTEQIYANLRQALLMGVWKPDQRLSARQLARGMSVSPTPMREAMMRLVNEGALEMTETRGFRTPKLSHAAYLEISRMRRVLEPMAAEIAAPIIPEAEIDRLSRLNESLGQAVSTDQFDVALQIDTEFHLGVIAAAQQPLLLSTIDSLLLRAGPTRTRLSADYRKSKIGFGHHEDVIAALRARDPEAARKEMAADLTDGSAVILALLENQQ